MMKCRHCHSELSTTFVDLGETPPSNAYLSEKSLSEPQQSYPLRVLVCENCWLVQTEDFASREELFEPEYAYFSGYSRTWLAHCSCYVDMVVERFGLNGDSLVMELAANDGYLLQFVKSKGVPCIGVEPTRAPAEAAVSKGIPIVQDFFGAALAKQLSEQGKNPDLLIANNVLAHVPDINDFVNGVAIVLKDDGIATFEFPHLLQLCENTQFDTIYHEHYSYLSLTAAKRVFEEHGLEVFDVEQLPTHGGSLRVYVQSKKTGRRQGRSVVQELVDLERERGLTSASHFSKFCRQVEQVRAEFEQFVNEAVNSGKSLGAYGAAAKGNTLLNYAGITVEQIPFVVDLNVNKQGKYLPGSRIPIVDEAHLKAAKPDCVVILPWNLKEEIVEQLSYVRDWGGKFVTAIPRLDVF